MAILSSLPSLPVLTVGALLSIAAAVFVPLAIKFSQTLDIQRKLQKAGVPIDLDEGQYHPLWGNAVKFRDQNGFTRSRVELMHKLGDVYMMRALHRLFVVIADPAGAKMVMQKLNLPKANYDSITELVGESLLTANGPTWSGKRKAINPAFHVTFLQNVLAPVVISKTRELMDTEMKTAALTHELVNVHEWLSKVTLDVIGIAGFGHDFGLVASKNSTSVSAMVLNVLDEPNQRTVNPLRRYYKISEGLAYDRNLRQFKALGRQIIRDARAAEARAGDSDDSKSILSLLLKQGRGVHGGDNRELSDEELLNEIMTFLLAGHETSASTLAFLFSLLHFYPDVKRKMFEEIDEVMGSSDAPTIEHLSKLKYMAAVLKETLRLFPIGPATARAAEEDVKIGDFTLPKGSNILVDFYLLHRNPKYWKDPEVFDPERFMGATGSDGDTVGSGSALYPPFAYLPFAGGPRSCIGKPFAELEIKIIMAMIGKKYDWQVVDEQGKPAVDDPSVPGYIPLLERFDATVTIRPHHFLVQFSQRQ
ncbi:hypothetical protein RI367_000771 [Sorochytrium milnesiophthora]